MKFIRFRYPLVLIIGCLASLTDSVVAQLAHQEPGIPMAERLRRLHENVDQREPTPYQNDRIAAILRETIASAEPGEDLREIRFEYAAQLLLAGATEDSIAVLEEMRHELHATPESPQRSESEDRILRQLALAYVRLGEQQNCIANHSAESCLFPIAGAGVHTLPFGSRKAITELMKILEKHPSDVAGVWLLNLAKMTLNEHPGDIPRHFLIPPSAFASAYDMPRFRDIAMTCNADVVGLAGGVCMDDFDGDGHLDLVTSAWGLHEQMRFLRNDGSGSFDDHTEQAGLIGEVGGLNMIHADYDNDGDLDVFVLRGAWLQNLGDRPNSLLQNDGAGRFTNVTESAGLLTFNPTQTAVWSDFNNDGWLDLFVGNESNPTRGFTSASELYLNNGDGTFKSLDSGINAFVKGAAAGDYDKDGRPDLFLSIHGGRNKLLRNEAEPGTMDITFQDVSATANVMTPIPSFPTWFFDYNNDGWLDLFVASYGSFQYSTLSTYVADYLGQKFEAPRCHLYENQRDGTFRNVAPNVRLDRILMPMGSNFGDLDNDGFLDCYFGTGEPALESIVPNRMFRNDRGERFQDVTTAMGVGHLQKGHGIAFGDLDHDGDQDIYAVMGGAFLGDFYQNALYLNPGNDNRWITLRLIGVQSNRSAIGARIRVDIIEGDEKRSIYNTVGAGGSFGASSLQQEIGLGRSDRIDRIVITWPASGIEQVFTDVTMNTIYLVREDARELEPVNVEILPLGSKPPEGDHHHHHSGRHHLHQSEE